MPLKAIERNILDIRIEDIPLFIQNIFYSNSLYSASVQHHGQFHNNKASGHILTKIEKTQGLHSSWDTEKNTNTILKTPRFYWLLESDSPTQTNYIHSSQKLL